MSVTFPDVCRTITPRLPVATPYPVSQYQDNLIAANKADAGAEAGSRTALADQAAAIANLESATGRKVKSATHAVMIGFALHARLNSK